MSANDFNSMDHSFFDEYTSRTAVRRYTKATAGYGITYLLDRDYKDVYVDALDRLPAATKQRGTRILEFGCGGGMNLIHLIYVLNQTGIKVEKAVGTDFSPALINAAKEEAQTYLGMEKQGKLEFHIARNERLIDDLAAATGVDRARFDSAFDFVLGVNTMRYCHRTKREMECARDLMRLLAPGGICVNIDMNDRFPAFRSALKDHFRQRDEEECYVPSLREYAAPFEKAGFEILRKENFCWVPHSAGKLMCGVMSAFSPVLDSLAKSRAMRSLIVARKPEAAQ